VPQATLIFYARLSERHHPPTKYALAKKQQGQKNRPQKA